MDLFTMAVLDSNTAVIPGFKMVRFQPYKVHILLFIIFIKIGASDSISSIPLNAEIITKVFELTSLRLSKGKYCSGCAPLNINDPTIGDFLSTFWEAHTDTCGTNRIRINTRYFSADSAAVMLKEFGYPPCGKNADRKQSYCTEAVWMIDFNICKRCDRENDRWCWGIRFLMKQSDRKVIPGTVWCLGAG